jgi:hypothetical protein
LEQDPNQSEDLLLLLSGKKLKNQKVYLLKQGQDYLVEELLRLVLEFLNQKLIFLDKINHKKIILDKLKPLLRHQRSKVLQFLSKLQLKYNLAVTTMHTNNGAKLLERNL